MELRQLRYFIAVKGHGNFSRAARHLRLSQSALSRQIKGLEEEIGFEVLARNGKTVALTVAGQDFYDDAVAILERFDRVIEQIRKRSIERPLRVAFLPVFVTGFLSKVLAHFQEQGGGHAELYDLTEEEIVARAKSGEIDVAFLPKGAESGVNEFQWTEVYQQPAVLVMPKTHRLAKLARINPKIIQNEILHGLGPPNYPGYVSRVEAMLRPFGVKPHFHKQAADGHLTLFAAVQATRGLAMQSEGVKDMLPRDLVVRPFHPPLPGVPVLVGVSVVRPNVIAAKFLKSLYQVMPGGKVRRTAAARAKTKPVSAVIKRKRSRLRR